MRHVIRTLPTFILAGALGSAPAKAELPDFVRQLSAGTIAAISDGDFVGQTYATGRLAPRDAKHRDLLTIMTIRDGRIGGNSSVELRHRRARNPRSNARRPDRISPLKTEKTLGSPGLQTSLSRPKRWP